MSFKKNKYQVLRNAISKDLAAFCYKYLQISAEADHWMLNNGLTHAGNKLVGNFNDAQVPNSYAKYADRVMETLLVDTIKVMQKKTGLKLVPTYSYCRLYKTGNILKRHKYFRARINFRIFKKSYFFCSTTWINYKRI